MANQPEGQPTNRAKRIGFVLISILTTVLCALLYQVSLFDNFENGTWDVRLRMIAEPSAATDRIRIIDIDQASLDFIARTEKFFWPWPRGLYVAAIEFLRRAQSRGLAIDVLFTEDQFFTVGESAEFESAGDDIEFASSMDETLPVVIAVSPLNNESDQGHAARKDERWKEFAKRQLTRDQETNFSKVYFGTRQVPHYGDALLPIKTILDKAQAFGNVSARPDSDKIFRHIVPGVTIGDVPLLSLPFALLEATGEKPEVDVPQLSDADGRLALRFVGGQRGIPTVPFADIWQSLKNLEAEVDPLVSLDSFRDKFVFLGMSAPGLMDLRVTPVSEIFPGVEFNATALENLLGNRFIRKTPLWLNILISAVLIMLVASLALFLHSLRDQVMSMVVTFMALVGAGVTCAFWGIWVPLFIPAIGMIVAFSSSLGLQYMLEGRQHRFIRGAFRYYVAPSVVDQIVQNPSLLSLGGEKRELTIYFSDIAGFTSLSESIEASRLVTLLNTYLTAMTETILESGGTVDKYVGDAVVAFWNAPLSVPDHAVRAVRAALQCQKRLEEMQAHFHKEYGVVVKARIGLNTGVVSVGNFGSENRFNYTVIGDAANLASRLEGANKYFGTSILLAQRTYELLGGAIETRRIASMRVLGKKEAVQVYEPKESFETQKMNAYQEALTAFDAGRLEDALELFRPLARDPVARLYVSRIQRDLEKKAPDWSPVWNLSEK